MEMVKNLKYFLNYLKTAQHSPELYSKIIENNEIIFGPQ